MIYLQFWAYGSWDLLFPISMRSMHKLMSPEHNIINDKIKNFASQKQNYESKMQDAQVTKSLGPINDPGYHQSDMNSF